MSFGCICGAALVEGGVTLQTLAFGKELQRIMIAEFALATVTACADKL